MMATGVARPRAQGQEMTRTAMAQLVAKERPAPQNSQMAAVSTERATTQGTKMREIRSARREMGALDAAASPTR